LTHDAVVAVGYLQLHQFGLDVCPALIDSVQFGLYLLVGDVGVLAIEDVKRLLHVAYPGLIFLLRHIVLAYFGTDVKGVPTALQVLLVQGQTLVDLLFQQFTRAQ